MAACLVALAVSIWLAYAYACCGLLLWRFCCAARAAWVLGHCLPDLVAWLSQWYHAQLDMLQTLELLSCTTSAQALPL